MILPRLVNSASGGNFMETGHILDIHNYPDAAMPDPKLFGAKQVLALGEFGDWDWPIDGHSWQQKITGDTRALKIKQNFSNDISN